MLESKRTPSYGLSILKLLYKHNPFHASIRNSLINAYICLGFHNQAIDLIKSLHSHKQDIQSLKFQAWLAHKQGDIEQERAIWNTILDRTYFAQVHSPISTLLLRSHKPLNLKSADIPLISVVRNEMLRLPFFLNYYRKLGVTQFIFVDNNSNDGSLEFLLGQPDCHVFWTNDSYFESGHGLTWINYIVKHYILPQQWYLVIDADEFLKYPNCEKIDLHILMDYLNTYGYEGLSSFIIDTFPQNSTKNEQLTSSDDLIEYSPYFYNKYHFYNQIECPYIKPAGGIRAYFGIGSWLTVLPLIKKVTNTSLMSSRHHVTPLRIADITSLLLHLKFIGSFEEKAKNEVKRKQHSGSGNYYKFYIDLLDNKLHEIERHSLIIRFQDSQQLVDLELIKSSDSWIQFFERKTSYAP